MNLLYLRAAVDDRNRLKFDEPVGVASIMAIMLQPRHVES